MITFKEFVKDYLQDHGVLSYNKPLITSPEGILPSENTEIINKINTTLATTLSKDYKQNNIGINKIWIKEINTIKTAEEKDIHIEIHGEATARDEKEINHLLKNLIAKTNKNLSVRISQSPDRKHFNIISYKDNMKEYEFIIVGLVKV